MQSYLASMADLGAETWIIHGTLLGWWWNRKVRLYIAPMETIADGFQILPWDSDIDVQMTNNTVGFLAKYYNMTVHTYRKRDYMLEVNPGYTNGSYKDNLNVIDARWIDYQTGLFIDITAVRPHETKRHVLCSKDQHEEKVLTHKMFITPRTG